MFDAQAKRKIELAKEILCSLFANDYEKGMNVRVGECFDLKKISRILSKIYRRQNKIHNGIISEFVIWRILNEVYLSESEGKRISVSDVGLAADLPLATSIRWLNHMADRNLILRVPDPADRRRVWLELTALGRECLEMSISNLESCC